MKVTDKYAIFENDDEFYYWVVIPKLITLGESGNLYTDFNLCQEYYDMLDKGIQFVIKDRNSQIFKHQAVSYRTITKPIKNLKYYYGEQFLCR